VTYGPRHFIIERTPEIIHPDDIVIAFKTIGESLDYDQRTLLFNSTRSRLIVYLHEGLFEKLYTALFTKQNIMGRTVMEEGVRHRELPTLFLNAEKTQVRQIPLMEEPPWDFKFLLELGGCIVIRTDDIMKASEECRQFMLNHSQWDMRVELKQMPDGSYMFFTYWFTHRGNKI